MIRTDLLNNSLAGIGRGFVLLAALGLSQPLMASTTDLTETAEIAEPAAAELVADPIEPTPEPAAEELKYSAGMYVPVDGSSLEAFNNSLEKIKEQTRIPEYTTLTGAIDYLMVYDLSAKKDRARLAKNLDGLTGAEIVDRVEWRKNPSGKKK